MRVISALIGLKKSFIKSLPNKTVITLKSACLPKSNNNNNKTRCHYYLRTRRWSWRSWSFFNSITLFLFAAISSDELTVSWWKHDLESKCIMVQRKCRICQICIYRGAPLKVLQEVWVTYTNNCQINLSWGSLFSSSIYSKT